MRIYKIDEYIMKYRFEEGPIIPTEAVIVDGTEIEKKCLDYFQLEIEDSISLRYEMGPEDIVLGLGQNQRGINKRGGEYISFCSDDPLHTPGKKSLYGTHNFLIVDGKDKFGVFIDYPGKVLLDIGFTHKDYIDIVIEDKNFDIYIIKGINPKEISSRFLTIIGDSYAPPKWAFGYQQCRWSYPKASEVERIGDRFIEHEIPCDAIYLDIDYMEDYKNFTISEERFPHFKAFVQDMKNKGFRLIPIIDAGVKIEEDYDVYEEGISKDYFCLDHEGNPFVAAVWPGKVHFPDFLRPEVRLWFGRKYGELIECGIEGFWNDMNEPAIFYTDRGIGKAIEKAKQSQGENLNIYSYFGLIDTFKNLSNNIEDYKSFYHMIDDEPINHYLVHNLYGYNMTRSTDEGFKEIDPNRRFLLTSRSSYIGMHRYSGIWTGDNHSWWEHILLNIKMMPSLNICGFLYSGADTGGFGGDANAQLVIRWTQFSLFTPLFRNHSAKGTRDQEPFAFDRESVDIIRRAIEFRYAIIPYIYSEYMKALIGKNTYISPLLFEYTDPMSRRVEDQLLVGESLMISPIYEENALGRYVWIPEKMLLWNVKDYRQRKYRVFDKGHAYMDVDLDQIPVFIRKNKILILGELAMNVDSMRNDQLTAIAFVEDRTEYIYYDDDGKSHDYKEGIYSKIVIQIIREDDDYKVIIDNQGNDNVKMIHFEIVDMEGNITHKTVDIG